MPGVLILTASIGAGHDLPAELLAAALRDLPDAPEVHVVDVLAGIGGMTAKLIEGGAQLDTRRGRLLFDAEHWLIARTKTGRRVAGRFGELIAMKGLRRILAGRRPDLVVSTYPGSTELLGRLRTRGELATPVISAITDLASLHWWAHPGVDLHLTIHPESDAEVRSIAGPAARITCVRGFSDERFLVGHDRADARARLGLPPDGAVIVVSGGGWGVGDLAGATRIAATVPDVARVVVLAGSRDDVRTRLTADLADIPTADVWGFTTEMPALLAAADVLIHSSAGLTVLEAQLQGCPVVSFGWGGGHIRANNAAYAKHGIATVVTSRRDLGAALAAAVAAEPEPTWPRHAAMPTAADTVVELLAVR